jgi:hypothetical protein
VIAFTLGLSGFKLCVTYGGGFFAGCYFIHKGITNPSTGNTYEVSDIIEVFLYIIFSTGSLS